MQPGRNRKVVIAGLLALATVATGALVLPALAPPSNCGGNSAALSACRKYGMTIRVAAANNNGEFEVSKLSDSDQKDMLEITANHWIRDATFLIKGSKFKTETDRKHVVAVWNRSYDNVPQPAIWNGWKRTPAHAVTYSDGSGGLISPIEFADLDLSGFVDTRKFAADLEDPKPLER